MKDLAQVHRLRTERLGDGETVIPGKRGFIARGEPGRLHWVLVYPGQTSPGSRWKNAAALDPLLTLEEEGDDEAIFSFDPADIEHVARRWCKARFKRRISEDQRARLAAMGAAHRFPAVEGSSGPQDRVSPPDVTTEPSRPDNANLPPFHGDPPR